METHEQAQRSLREEVSPAAALSPPPPAPADSNPGLAGADESSGPGGLSAASGALSGAEGLLGGLSSSQHQSARRSDPGADFERSPSMQPPRSPRSPRCPGIGSAVPAAAAGPPPPAALAPAAQPRAQSEAAPEEESEGEAAAAAAAPPSQVHPEQEAISEDEAEEAAPTVAAEEAGEHEAAQGETVSAPPPAPAASGSPRLSVRQMMELREHERVAAAELGQQQAEHSPPVSSRGSSCAGGSRASPAAPPSAALPASRSHSRLASGRSLPAPSSASPARNTRRRAPPGASPPLAHAGSSAASSAVGSSSPLSLGGEESTLLRPTASFVAAVEATESRRQLRAQQSLPCHYQPKPTDQRPFRLACDERAKGDFARVGGDGVLTSEEKKAKEAAAGRVQLANELKTARERCRRTLSAAPARHTPPREVSPPQFKPFKLRSLERHEAYASAFHQKLEAQQRQEEVGARRSPSRIGAVHASSGGATPPTLSTGQRATHYQERSAEKQQREAAEAEQREAKRLAQLTAAERAEEEERRAHRFRARAMPDHTRQPFVPDKSKVPPPTKPHEFRFNARFGSSPPAIPEGEETR
ncbi:hypothetical protein C2E20_1420 [Micractinium conductrix]|uniref:Uncharacterized protein n=1 Tax=Micractinium conductrix TaxID=554055 RepID=A0A2P6VNA6_9CHLO|nr:hypothetical protein C2E20_1420 [Micractinium conductrix]|eukprot:PSC75578.1 hypothetical protein C2E20_1420 [Micractinium conductrix]